jgi:hypothetical protein
MLWQWAVGGGVSVLQGSFAWLVQRLFESPITEMLEMVFTTVQAVPEGALNGGLALLAIAIPLSAWGMVRLTRTPAVKATYGN